MEASGIPEPKPRSGFLKRHRGTLVTLGIVLYTAALGVAVCDDVFHLGLFPTTYEREVRSLIAAFDSADESSRREAADRLCREADAFIAIPELIRALGNKSQTVRGLAIECLRRITKADLPFDPASPPAERRAAIAAWRAWWRENREQF